MNDIQWPALPNADLEWTAYLYTAGAQVVRTAGVKEGRCVKWRRVWMVEADVEACRNQLRVVIDM